jgi:integrase
MNGLPRPKRPAKAFEYQEIKDLLLSIPNVEDKFLIALMYANGARVGEAINVRGKDIDWNKDFVYINLPVFKKRKEIPPKRNIPISREKESWLADLIINYAVGKKGKLYRFTKRTAQKRVDKWLNCTSHSLRHSRVTHCLKKLKMGLPMVAKYFNISPRGFSDWIMRYGHYDTGDFEQHIKGLDKS